MLKNADRLTLDELFSPPFRKKANVSQSTDGIYSNYRQQMRARVRCFFPEPIGSPLKNWNCVRKSTEIQGEWHGIRHGCVIHWQPKSNRKSLLIVKWKVSPAKHCNCLTKPIRFRFLPWSKHKCKEPIPVRWYSRLQLPNCFDYEQYVSRCFSGDALPRRGEKEFNVRACLPEWTAFKPTTSACHLPSDVEGNRITGTLRMNMRGNGPVLKSDTVCDLHMLNEAKIYISEMLIPAPVSSSTVSAPV